MTNEASKLKQKQALKKYLVFTLMFAVFAGSMYLIFAPSEKDRKEKEQSAGFNTELPDPRNAGIIGDKKTAYEQEMMRLKQKEKMRTLEELTFGPETEKADSAFQNGMLSLETDGKETQPSPYGGTTYRGSSFNSSNSAYKDINRTLGSFYEQPREDPEKEALREEVEALREAVSRQQNVQPPSYDEQLALLEKSYELAAKYMPAGENTSRKQDSDGKGTVNGRAVVAPVGQVKTRVVSSLARPLSDSALIAGLSQPRNRDFVTAVGSGTVGEKNTIRVCVHGDQTILNGQSVRLRLLEPMWAGNMQLPRNTLVTGIGRIQGDRLGISIVSLEHGGMIIPVELTVYDSDGQEGIYIPNSAEVSAVKEVGANLGQNLGTSISITNQSAGDQLLSELGKGAIQGVSQYISKKIREEKVHLKSGYSLMLSPKKNN